MLAKIAPGKGDFLALARYLVHGKGRERDPRRVAWLKPHNLPTDDPELAAKYMTATAQRSPRTRNAVYHMMISWHQREHPSPEAMQEIAFRTLELAGLGEHQALIMGHDDRPYPHLHMMINRVHPDTCRAWSTKHDFARFDRIMRELADGYGFEHAPAHLYNPEQTFEQPKTPRSRAYWFAKRRATVARPQWSRATSEELSEELSENLTRSSTSEDVAWALAGRGLALETSGSGFIVGNSSGYVKLSTLRLEMGSLLYELFAGLAEAVHPKPPYRRTVFTVDEIDITRAFVSLGLLDRSDLRDTIANVAERRAEADTSQYRSNSLQSTALTPIECSNLLKLARVPKGKLTRPSSIAQNRRKPRPVYRRR